MRATQIQVKNKLSILFKFKQKIRHWTNRLKEFHGDPHNIALGMAIGVFVAMTPIIPFHTIIAVSLSFLLRGSKAAAAIAVWISNPLTIPILYFASYKAGVILFGTSIPGNVAGGKITEILKHGLDVTMGAIGGGIVIGILPGIATYFITRKIVSNLRARKKTIPDNFYNSQL